MSATPRLFVEADLSPGGVLTLPEDQAHYLQRVLRLVAGDAVKLFNGRDGEFFARLAASGRRELVLTVEGRLRDQSAGPDLWLLFSPLKKTRTDFVIEKAAELGASLLWPVLTARTAAERIRADRLRRIAVEASEQTERLDVPVVREALPLPEVLAGWDAGRTLFYCDEGGRAQPIQMAAVHGGGPAAILVGPEGGFTDPEREWLSSHTFVKPVSLGPRILRAETAALAALAVWQAIAGDWSEGAGGSRPR